MKVEKWREEEVKKVSITKRISSPVIGVVE